MDTYDGKNIAYNFINYRKRPMGSGYFVNLRSNIISII